MPEFLNTASGRAIAYNRLDGSGPGVVFLGGFCSDMEGSKALFLQDWAGDQGRAFLRFDYSGHGQSSGDFADGAIGDWLDDARAAIAALTEGPQILVGSSMGGWIALLLARDWPEKVAGLVGIAAAPDFTTRLWELEMTPAEREEVSATGRLSRPSGYDDGPYIFTRRLFEDGASHRVFDRALPLPIPAHFLHGTEDDSVPTSEALRILDHASGPDLRLTLVKGADHRFSSPECLTLLARAITGVTERARL